MRWDLSASGEAVVTKYRREEGKKNLSQQRKTEGGGRSRRVEIMGGKPIAGERKDNTETPL